MEHLIHWCSSVETTWKYFQGNPLDKVSKGLMLHMWHVLWFCPLEGSAPPAQPSWQPSTVRPPYSQPLATFVWLWLGCLFLGQSFNSRTTLYGWTAMGLEVPCNSSAPPKAKGRALCRACLTHPSSSVCHLPAGWHGCMAECGNEESGSWISV